MALFREVVARGRGWLPFVAAASVIGTAITLALPAVLGSAIDTLIAGGDSTRLTLIALGLIGLAIVTELGGAYAGQACSATTTAWLRLRLVRHVLHLHPHRTAEWGTGDLVARVSGNAAEAAQAGTGLVAASVAVLPPLGSLVLLARIDLLIAAAFLAGVGLVSLVLRAFARRTSAVAAEYQRTQGTLAGLLTEALQGIRTIAAARTAEREQARILTPLAQLREFGSLMWQAFARSSAQAAIVGPVVLVAVLAVGGVELASGRITPGELFAASRYAVVGAGLGALTGVLGALSRARSAMGRVGAVLGLPALEHGSRGLPSISNGQLEFREVSLGSLLRNVNLTVPGGAAVAVIGSSGSGKSVLAALASRLRDPDEGAVLLDGVPLGELSHEAFHDAVGCAFERPNLFGHTVNDAIGLGREPAQVARAAEAVHAHSFIIRLPRGYRNPLAETPMSGGERQRLGLARAWHARRLLVLDDATSSVDMVTELKIARALTDGAGHRTRLIVTHRASTAARADLVLWLENGKVRGFAPHGKLWDDPDYRAVLT